MERIELNQFLNERRLVNPKESSWEAGSARMAHRFRSKAK